MPTSEVKNENEFICRGRGNNNQPVFEQGVKVHLQIKVMNVERGTVDIFTDCGYLKMRVAGGSCTATDFLTPCPYALSLPGLIDLYHTFAITETRMKMFGR